MPFINTLPYISNPIEEFSDFKYVSWEKEIYPKFKGGTEPKEVQFFAEILKRHNIKSILDLGIGGGIELAGIAKHLQSEKYGLTSIEGNEIDDDFIQQAGQFFQEQHLQIQIHKANWIDLPSAQRPQWLWR